MCGILGIIPQKGKTLLPSIGKKALATLAHRGPDSKGIFQVANGILGHHRLSIFDTSDMGHQPMTRGEYTIVFNGAIYNFLELRQELRQKGHHFTTQSDTEVILAAYAEWGEHCVQRFNGMWAFALADHVNKKLFCSRDRYGIKPFYYRCSEEFPLAFASEIKAFTHLPDWKAQANYQRAYEFLYYGWQDHTSETLFDGVYHLLPGHQLWYDWQTQAVTIKAYYQLADIPRFSKNDLSEAEAIKGVRHLLQDSVRLRLRADVPCGLTLSGGLDSSAIAGLARVAQGESSAIHAYSVIFPSPEISEKPYVEAVAQAQRLTIHQLTPSAEYCWMNYDRFVYHQDEPFSSAGIPAHFELMNLANQQGFKVLLNGQGADEILAGYDRFYGPWLRQQKGIGMVSALGNLLRYQPFSRQTLGKQLAIFLHHNNGSKHPIFSPALINKHPNSLFQRTPDTDLRSCSEHLLTEVGFPVLLHYEDRNTMAFGIEMRTPFLDYRLVAFALGLPDAYKLKGGMRKYLLREAVADVLPEKVKQRHTKLGFATPQNAWMDANALPLIASIRAAAHQYVPVFSADLPAWTEQVLQQKQYPHYAMLWRIFSFVRWLAVFEVQMTK